jgi:hypothetical protein
MIHFYFAQTAGTQIALVMLAIPFLIMSVLSLIIVIQNRKANKQQSKKVITVGIVATILWIAITGGIFV